MQPEIKQLVQSIHDAPERIVLVAAGAGTEALSNLLGVAGATRTMLEALIPTVKQPSTTFWAKRQPNMLRNERRACWPGAPSLAHVG